MNTNGTTNIATTPATKQEFLCPIHLIPLTHLLRGDIGHCRSCGLYVEPLNHKPIELSPGIVAKRAAEVAKPTKRKRRAAA